MDDMASALGSILNNPQAMQQIMSLASQLGLGGPPEPAQQETPAPPPVEPQPVQQPAPVAPHPNLNFGGANIPPAAPPQNDLGNLGSLLGNIDINTIAKISQIMGSLNTHDDNVDLLLALKPHFGEKRRKKVDDAIRIMQLVKVLPLLKETGIFGSLFGGGDS